MRSRALLVDAISALRGPAAADRMCVICAALTDVHAAAITVVLGGVQVGILGASGPAARRYADVSFVAGEGPCLDAAAHGVPMTLDMTDVTETRWPLYRSAMSHHPVEAVTLLPVIVGGHGVGVLNVFHLAARCLTGDHLATATLVAHLAALAFEDLLDQIAHTDPDADDDGADAVRQVVYAEVAQATGVLVADLNVDANDACARLRAHAYATDTTATGVARAVLDRQLRLERT